MPRAPRPHARKPTREPAQPADPRPEVDRGRGPEAVRAALLEATAAMLGEVGPRALTVRAVAERAGVNHGQVHHYFGSKRALLEAGMRWLAERHFARALARSGGDPIPPALGLAEDPLYWRAICRVVLEGDLALARIEVDADVSVPRRALRALLARGAAGDDELGFRARFAANAALQLGWVAFEEFVLLAADVGEADRAAVRERVRRLVAQASPVAGAGRGEGAGRAGEGNG